MLVQRDLEFLRLELIYTPAADGATLSARRATASNMRHVASTAHATIRSCRRAATRAARPAISFARRSSAMVAARPSSIARGVT